MLAEVAVGSDEGGGVADVVVGCGTAASGEVDGSDEVFGGVGGEGDGSHAAGRDADGEDACGVDLGKLAAEVDCDAKVFGGFACGAFVVGIGTVPVVEVVGFAAGGSVAASHDDKDYKAATGEPTSLRKEQPRGDVIAWLDFAGGTVGDNDEGMLAGEIGIDQKRAESVRRCFSPRDAGFRLVHLQCERHRLQSKEQNSERKKKWVSPHRIKLTQSFGRRWLLLQRSSWCCCALSCI